VSPTRDDRAALERRLRPLRRRAQALGALRALTAGAAAGLAVLLLASLGLSAASGPVPVALAWVATIVASVLAGGWAARAVGGPAGDGPAELARVLQRVDPRLAAETRSALELAALDRPGASPDTGPSAALVAAHRRRVIDQLAGTRPRDVLPWGAGLTHPAIRGGLLVALLAVLGLGWLPGSLPGRYALFRPGLDAGAGRVASVVEGLSVTLRYPDHLERRPETLVDPDRIEAPQGTTVDLEADLLADAAAAELALGEARVALRVAPGGSAAAGSFVVREDTTFRLRARLEDGRWVDDARVREVVAVVDGAPRITLLYPEGDRLVTAEENLVVAWHAEDDVGVAEVVLVAEGPGGTKRRRLDRWDGDAVLQEVRGSSQTSALALGAGPGDTLTVWLEAADGDRITGPHVGRSAEIRLTVADPSDLRTQRIAALRALLDRGLDALADRLERPIPAGSAAGRRRFQAVSQSTRDFLEALEEEREVGAQGRPDADDADDASARGLPPGVDLPRLRQAERGERGLHPAGGDLASEARRVEADRTLVAALEDADLALADALGEARLGDVAAMARELDALRREMASLVQELARGAGGAETKAALERALAKAEARMREIGRRLAEMGDQVPRDFLNRGSASEGETRNALADLRQALADDDVDAAAKHLAELERSIDALAGGLAGAEDAYAEASRGPGERALAEMLDALAGVEDEQRALLGRSGEVGRRAGDRALEESRSGPGAERLDGLAKRADELAEGLEGLGRPGTGDEGDGAAESRTPSRWPGRFGRGGGLAPFDEELRAHAEARLADARDALRAGDLGEAREMMRAAAGAAQDLARDLDLGARMFPGAHGDDASLAEEAGALARDTAELEREVAGSVPRLERFVGPEERQALAQDAARQRATREALESLGQPGEGGDAEGNTGEPSDPGRPPTDPLSPEDRAALAEAAEAMRRAERELQQGDPLDANTGQQRAAERLAEVRRRLMERGRGGGQGQQGPGRERGGSEGMGRWAASREPVEIPRGEDFVGPTEQRRRVVEAMREEAPAGYREAVERYYQELLR